MKNFNSELQKYCSERIDEFSLIDDKRKTQLILISDYLETNIRKGKPAKLCFICTHNSRRSQFGHIWSFAAANWYNLNVVQSYSGGTEATAINSRAVAALIRAGFIIENLSEGNVDNPGYLIKLSIHSEAVSVFSKVYNHQLNPTNDFAAIMVCSDADEKCPIIPGAEQRFYLPYDDPKLLDNTEFEVKEYDNKCKIIARDMLYLFSNINISI